MKPAIRLTVLGVLVYLGSLALTAPASLIGTIVPKALEMHGLTGSLWSGKASSALFSRRLALGPITWHFTPLDLVLARAGLRLEFSPPGLSGQAHVAAGPFGFEASDVKLDCEAGLFNTYVSDIGDLRGRVTLDLDHVSFTGDQLKSAQGHIEWKDARLRYSRILKLGQMKADVKDQADMTVAQVSNVGGDLQIGGTLSVDRQGNYQIRLTYTPTAATPADVRDGIKLMGQPDATGSVTVTRKGRLGS